MKNYAKYYFDYPNKNDDDPNILKLFTAKTIIGVGLVSKALPINRKEYGI